MWPLLDAVLRERTFLVVAAGVAVGYGAWSFLANVVAAVMFELDALEGAWGSAAISGIALALLSVVATLALAHAKR